MSLPWRSANASQPIEDMGQLAEPLLRTVGLRKTFGGLHALENIDLSVWPGEVVGLVGDNGAGKSTLVRCIAGYYIPDAGEVFVDGQPFAQGGPKRAAELGIEIVHQDLSLVMHGDVVQNLISIARNSLQVATSSSDRLARQESNACWGARDLGSGRHWRDSLGASANTRLIGGTTPMRRDWQGGWLEPAFGVS